MAFFSFLPKENAMLPDLAFRWPRRYRHLLRYTHKILRQKSALSTSEKELIGGYVSGLNACNFCYSIHSTLADRFGIPEAKLEALLKDIGTAPIDDKLKPIFHYVRKVTLTPAKVVQADIDAITAAGWKEKTAIDALSIAAAFAAWNRLMDGTGMPAVPEKIKVETTNFMYTKGYMPWYMAPIFGLIGLFKDPD